MDMAIIFALGVITGCILVNVGRRIKSVGVLRVDWTDPDGPYIFLEISRGDAITLSTQKYALMQVKLRGYIPQK